MADDLTGFAIVAAACILGAAALAISVRVSRAVTTLIAILLALAPLIGLIFKITRLNRADQGMPGAWESRRRSLDQPVR